MSMEELDSGVPSACWAGTLPPSCTPAPCSYLPLLCPRPNNKETILRSSAFLASVSDFFGSSLSIKGSSQFSSLEHSSCLTKWSVAHV